MSISALIITKNEQKNIKACLESLEWVDEIVIIDALSTDDTVEIAKQFTDKVYLNPWPGYAKQKNFGQAKCTKEWVICMDADERVTPKLRDEIQEAIKSVEIDAYRIRRKDYMFGRWIEHTSKDSQNQVRVYRASQGKWENSVHEVVRIEGVVGQLSQKMLHLSHLTIYKFLEKANQYTEIEAKERFDQGIRKGWPTIIMSTFQIFFNQYIIYGGYKDKGHGLLRAILLAFYHFLVRAKLWELWYKYDHSIVE